jgi:hypothetical protein
MLIDHIIYAAPDLEIAVADIERRFGVRASGGGKHTGQGTHNKLLSLGPERISRLSRLILSNPSPPSHRRYGVDGVASGGLEAVGNSDKRPCAPAPQAVPLAYGVVGPSVGVLALSG